jgi:hypothetical protein
MPHTFPPNPLSTYTYSYSYLHSSFVGHEFHITLSPNRVTSVTVYLGHSGAHRVGFPHIEAVCCDSLEGRVAFLPLNKPMSDRFFFMRVIGVNSKYISRGLHFTVAGFSPSTSALVPYRIVSYRIASSPHVEFLSFNLTYSPTHGCY